MSIVPPPIAFFLFFFLPPGVTLPEQTADAYRVGAKKGGKMNAGLKAYLAKKKKKGKK